MSDRIKLGISSCLLGEKVRYDGGHKLAPYLVEALNSCIDWVPVCPEVEMGLTIPREPMILFGDPAAPRLVTVHTRIDHTDLMLRWADEELLRLSAMDLHGFIFKSGSPSCGIKKVNICAVSGGSSNEGAGMFARELMACFPLLPVQDEVGLKDAATLENFVTRISGFKLD